MGSKISLLEFRLNLSFKGAIKPRGMIHNLYQLREVKNYCLRLQPLIQRLNTVIKEKTILIKEEISSTKTWVMGFKISKNRII